MHEVALISALRALYESAGFRAYKMRKFEEYSLYLENRDFLLSDYVITFSDLTGRLLALKPDVTLSIVKGSRATKEAGEKLYYTESVYRLDSRTNEYREIRQMGLEALGDIDDVQTLEVCRLALESLVKIDEKALMDISHMGYLRPFLSGVSAENRKRILESLRGKNAAALQRACCESEMEEENAKALLSLLSLSGDFETGLRELRALSRTEEQAANVSEMESLFEGLRALELESHVRLDFSIANDLSYYTGIVFQGYIRRAHRAVLSGGRYDGLMQKFKRGVGALGFAIYLSDIAPAEKAAAPEADVLLLYSPGASPALVTQTAEEYRRAGKSVRIEKHAPEGKTFGMIVEVN